MLSSEEISHIAKLAKLRLEPTEREAAASELSRVLDYIKVLDQVDTGAVGDKADRDASTPEADRRGGAERRDTARPGMKVESLLQNAPESLDRFLLVPAIKCSLKGLFPNGV